MKSKEQLKQVFENGDKPKQEDFWEWQDSYWHKEEGIPIESLEGIDDLIAEKTNTSYKGDLLKTDPAPTQIGFYGLLEKGVYPNLGNLNAPIDSINFASFDGTNWNLIYAQVDLTTTVTDEDLTFETVNFFNPANVKINTLINSSGGIQTVTGWKISKDDVSALVGQSVSFFGKTGTQGLYYAFYDINNTLISFAAYNPTLVKTVTVPSNAKWLYIDIKRPEDADDSVFANFMLNVGASILQYEPFNPKIVEIKGMTIKGVSEETGRVAYDQSLNTTDNVEFNSVTANEVEIPGVLKKGTLATPPTELLSGEFWLDTSDSSVNPILRQKQ